MIQQLQLRGIGMSKRIPKVELRRRAKALRVRIRQIEPAWDRYDIKRRNRD